MVQGVDCDSAQAYQARPVAGRATDAAITPPITDRRREKRPLSATQKAAITPRKRAALVRFILPILTHPPPAAYPVLLLLEVLSETWDVADLAVRILSQPLGRNRSPDAQEPCIFDGPEPPGPLPFVRPVQAGQLARPIREVCNNMLQHRPQPHSSSLQPFFPCRAPLS